MGGKEAQNICVHKNLPALAFVFVLIGVALLAMSPRVFAAPLSVSISPSTLYRPIGQSGTFTATASGGTLPYTFQWFEGSTIVGTSASLTISKSIIGTYSFQCIVTDYYGIEPNLLISGDIMPLSVVSSNYVTLVVGPSLNVSASPPTLSRIVGQSGTFTATASQGTPPYFYQWFEGYTQVGGSVTLSISKNAAGTYSFYCRVYDNWESTATSNTVTLTVIPPLNVSASPPTLSRIVGQSGTFTATASQGTPPYTYQWFEGTTTVGTSATLSISKNAAGTYSFYCKVTDSAASTVNSNTVTLVVSPPPPSVSVSPSTQNAAIGQSMSFTASASQGTPPYTYQWFEGTTTVGTSATLSISKNAAGTYSFYCKVTDSAAATLNSNTVTLTATADGFPLMYLGVVVAIIAVATIVGAVAYSFLRSTPRNRPPGEEKVKVPPPFFSKLRWIQAQVFELSPRGKQRIRRTNALHANAPHSLNVRVGPADQEWLTPPEESALPEDKLTWKNGVSHLQVVFSEPNHSPEPQTREIVLPREGSSTTCRFNFNPRSEVPYFKGRVIVLNGNRVVQTALLEGKVVPEPDQFLDSRLQFTVESVIQPNLGDLSSRKAFDLAFVANHTVDNSPAVVTICHEEAFFNNLKNIETPIKEITRILENVVERPDDFPKSMEDDRNLRWLRDLAINGRGLYGGIVVDQIGEKRLEKINRVQLVSTVDEYLPLEFIYDLPAPDFQARLCPKWREALEKGPEELEEGLCKDCKIKRSLSPAEFLCPLGFWGLRLVVERHYIDPYNKPDLKGYAFALKGESVEGRRGLRVLKSAIFAASEKVDEVVPQSQDVFKVLQDVTHRKVEQVTTLESWRDAVVKLQPSLLVLLTHISPCSLDPRQPQMEIGKGVGLAQIYINRQYLVTSEEAPRPVVLLLGCTTLSTNIPFRSFAASFRREGAAIVLSTITDVLGRHIAPVTAQLVHNLEEAAEKGLSMGDALVLVRRRALADGIPVVLSLVGIGDADWRFETVEVN